MRAKSGLSILLAAFLLLTGLSGAPAAATERDVIRVAYPIQDGLTTLDENGQYSGYSYEYLQEIAQYTGWDYEFVTPDGDMDESLTALLGMLERGEIDLMGGILYSDGMADRYDYSSQSYGVVNTVLQSLSDGSQPIVVNAQRDQTLRIAVAGTATRSIAELEDYCSINLIHPVYVTCETVAEQLDALRSGDADVMLNTSLNLVPGVRTVASFSPKPFYFITPKGADPELMAELNNAILTIEQSTPSFSSGLYEKYFTAQETQLLLSDEERAYIDSAGVLKVAVLTQQPPFQYQDEDGTVTGIAVGLLHHIADATGLTFEYVPCDTYAEAFAKASAGEVQLLAGMNYDYTLARNEGLSLTRSYLTSQYILLLNQSISEDSIAGRRLALSSISTYQGPFLGNVAYYESTDACIQAVERGQADYTYVDAYTAQYYINQPSFRNLKLVSQTYTPRESCFGLAKPMNPLLLTTLNKAINAIEPEVLQAIIYQNTLVPQGASLADFIRQHPVETILVVSAVAALIILLLLLFLVQRSRLNRRISQDLEKHYRIYSLVNEYFFEYHYENGILTVFTPAGEEGGKPNLTEYSLNVPSEDAYLRKVQASFSAVILTRADGVYEHLLPCLDGQSHWLRIALETAWENGVPLYTLGKINVIDDEMREKEALLEQAQRDSLTHIYNAETSRRLIQAALAALQEGEMGALLLLDIDHFKDINDTYGHMEGDRTLRVVAELLQDNFRQEDVVGRPGGDEFIVYMRQLRDVESLRQKCALLCRQMHAASLEHGITISLGAVCAAAGDGYEALYQRADEALYAAKQQGRDRYCIAGDIPNPS